MLARARLHSALLALAVGLVPGGCGDESACASITDAALWTDPPSGPLCVLGDLNVVARRPDELTVLAQVEAVEGSIVIHDNPALVELPLGPALTRVGASLSISANPALTTVRGFPALTQLGEALYVAENPALVELRFADGVSTVGEVFLALNPRLTMLEGLATLESVDGDLLLAYNDALEDVPLPALREVHGSLRLEGNASLRSVTMPALRTIGENWDIVNEDARDSLSDFASLEHVGWATIEGNSSIKMIEWPASLEVIRMLSIVANDGLEELTGAASGARETSTEWRIVDNPSLTRNEFVSELACTFQLDVCGETPGEVVGAGWAVMLGGSCDDPDFYGSASADDVMIATQRTIQITKAGRYRLRGNGAKVELTRCGRCAEQTLYEYAYLGEVEVDLDAGRYAIEMMPREESVVLLEIAPIDPLP